LAPGFSARLVLGIVAFRPLDGALLDEQALTFVAVTRTRMLDHDRGSG
jgi:hypothetical protein